MFKLRAFCLALVTLVVAACGGGGGDTILNPGGTLPGGTQVASIQLTASSNTLNSSATGANVVTIQALVLDSGNAVVPGTTVAFQTTSGSVVGIQSITDETGTAIAELSNGLDPSNRSITVTATAGQVQGSVTIDVIGTTLTVSGPPALALNDSADYVILLQDSQGAGVQTSVNVSSANGNTLSSTAVQTSVGGDATVTLTAANAGTDTITATALGESGTATVDVSGDIFSIQTPFADQEINLNTMTNVVVLWTKNGVPQVGETITFTSTRGTLLSSMAVTDGAGEATVMISSNSAGMATISATNDESTTTIVDVEFVATTADTLDLQANPLTVGVNGQSTVTATVRDANGNLVKNKIVVFVIEQDSTGNSFLSVGSDVTDSQGRATSVYTAGGVPSPAGGVVISGTVQDTPAATDTVPLTVAGRAIDMSIGTGDELFEPTTSIYSKEWVIIVTDTTGTSPEPVANTNVQASIRSVNYLKGGMQLVNVGMGTTQDFDWVPQYAISCPDEDTNLDGFLDLVTEDVNNNGNLEAGNRATLTALPPGAPAEACGAVATLGGATTVVQTDDAGLARVCVVYPQSDNTWVDVRLTSLLTVFGTEFSESQDFILEALASDLDDENSSPAGQTSPFGTVADCMNPN